MVLPSSKTCKVGFIQPYRQEQSFIQQKITTSFAFNKQTFFALTSCAGSIVLDFKCNKRTQITFAFIFWHYFLFTFLIFSSVSVDNAKVLCYCNNSHSVAIHCFTLIEQSHVRSRFVELGRHTSLFMLYCFML